MDSVIELLNYFPIDTIDTESGTGDQYLADLKKTIDDNICAGNYQVAYFYSHLLFMSYVYYSIETAYHIQPERVSDIYYSMRAYMGRDDKPSLEKLGSIYYFSRIPEKDIFKIFYALGMDTQKISAISNYVSSRDEFAHASGKGNIDSTTFDFNKKAIYGNMQSIHDLFKPYLKGKYIEFLLKNYSLDLESLEIAIEDLLIENSYSFIDISFFSSIGLSSFRNSNDEFKKNYRFIKRAHSFFYLYCIKKFNLPEPDDILDIISTAYKNNADYYIERELGIDGYTCAREGGFFPVYSCPECSAEQVASLKDNNGYHCFECGITFDEGELDFCPRCGCLCYDSDGAPCNDCIERLDRE